MDDKQLYVHLLTIKLKGELLLSLGRLTEEDESRVVNINSIIDKLLKHQPPLTDHFKEALAEVNLFNIMPFSGASLNNYLTLIDSLNLFSWEETPYEAHYSQIQNYAKD